MLRKDPRDHSKSQNMTTDLGSQGKAEKIKRDGYDFKCSVVNNKTNKVPEGTRKQPTPEIMW